MDTFECRKLLADFLNRWPIGAVQRMNLQEYVDVKNPDTFCQWIETRTLKLGSTKGGSSIKFGIYKKDSSKNTPKQYFDDAEYLWQLKQYGSNKNDVFDTIKQYILEVIQLSIIGNFEQIENIRLPNTLKWKVAFLYSNERLIPIYKKEVLFRIANEELGLKTNSKTQRSEIQKLLINKKPIDWDIYRYTGYLWGKFGEETERKSNPPIPKNQKGRNSAHSKSTENQTRNTSEGSVIAEQKHNKIQEKLKNLLLKQYEQASVILEENYVDIKLIQDDSITFYEVKSDSYASDCVVKALGQILRYSFRDSSQKPIKLRVVGQFAPTENELGFIDFIKKKLSIDFDYINVSIGDE